MSDQAEMNVEFGLSTDQAAAELNRLRNNLRQLTGDFVQAQNLIEQRLQKTARALKTTFDKMTSESASLRQARARSATLAEASQGTTIEGRIAGATTRALINDIQNSGKVMEARVSDAIVRTFSQVMRNTSKAVEARMKQEAAKIDRLLAETTDDFLQAQSLLRGQRMGRTIRSATPEQLRAAENRDRFNERRRLNRWSDEGMEAWEAEQVRKSIERHDRKVAAEKNREEQRARAARREETAQRNKEAAIQKSADAEERRTAAKQASYLQQQNWERNQFSRVQTARQREADQIAFAATPYGRAQEVLRDRRQRATIQEAQVGSAAMSMNRTWERFDLNGGADIMGLQGRLMANGMALAGVFNAVRGLADYIVQFDKELKNFQAISQATNSELTVMRDRFDELSQTVPFTSLELAQGATIMAQAGLSVREIGDSLASVAQFATASGSDLASSIDLITSSMTAFNLQTSQTADVANTFTSALNLSKLTVDRLVVGMNYLGPTAAEVGMSLGETVAMLGALAQTGTRASTAATGARALLVDLQNPSEKFAKILKDLGMAQADVNVETQGFLPVLEKLRERGFGAAQAYEAFELRAAAAYVALSNNTEMAYELEKAFTLSNAAAEAAAIQMESLSATGRRFYSTVAGAASDAFAPLVEVLRLALSGATDLIAGLKEMPGVLNLIALAATAVGAASFFSLMGTILRGLRFMVPVFGSLSAGMTSFGTATTAAGGAVAFLSTVLRANPIVMALTIFTTAATGLYMWAQRANQAAEALDDVKSHLNAVTGEADAADKKLQSLDQAISNVIKRRDALENNPKAFETYVVELQQQFKELGSTIDASKSSVTDLIKELYSLRDAELTLRESALGRQQAAQEAVGAAERFNVRGFFTDSDRLKALREAGSDLYGDPTLYDSDKYRISRQERVRRQNRSWSQSIASSFDNSSVNRVFDILSGNQRAFNIEDAAGNSALMEGLRTEIEQLNTRRNAEGVTAETIEAIDQSIEFLKVLAEQFGKLEVASKNVAASVSQGNLTRLQRQEVGVQNTGAFGRLSMSVTDLEGQLRQEFANIQAGGRGAGGDDRLRNMASLREVAEARLSQLRTVVDEAAAEALKRNPELYPGGFTQARKFAQQALDKVASPLLEIISAEGNMQEEQTKLLQKETDRRMQDLRRDLARLGRRRNDALDAESLRQVEAGINDVLKSMQEVIQNKYASLKAWADNEAQREDLGQEEEEALANLAETVDEQLLENTQRANELLKADLARQAAAIEDSMDSVRKQIDETIETIKRTQPGAALDALKTKLTELFGMLTGLGNQASEIQIQNDALETGSEPLSKSRAVRANRAMQFYLGRGVPRPAAIGIVSNLLGESGLAETAMGDYENGSPTSFGIAQWHNERATRMKAALGGNWKNFDAQLEYVLTELKRDYGSTYDKLMAETDYQRATTTFMREFEAPREDAKHRPLPGRLRYANTLAGGEYQTQAAEIAAKQKEADQAIQETTTKNVVAGLDAQIKNAKSQLGRLSGQVNLAGTTEALNTIRDKVRAWHESIMKAELQKFDAENTEAATQDPTGTSGRRKELIDQLRARMNLDLAEMAEKYYTNAEREIDAPVREAQTRLEVMNMPHLAGKFTDVQRRDQERVVALREQEALLARIRMLEEQIALAQQAQAATDPSSQEHEQALLRETELKARLVELTQQKNAVDAATASQGPTVAQAIKAANQAWMEQQGIMQDGRLLTAAEQVQGAWTEAMNGISGALNSFFMDIFSGTMDAEESFKKLGLSIVQTFMQIISKQLVNQLMMSLIGGGGGLGSGVGGSLLEGLFAVVGGDAVGANGGGVPGAAAGELVPGHIKTRDSVLRKVMPGEFILRSSAVQQIGRNKLNAINALGNRTISMGSPGMPVANDNQPAGPQVLNVWVVSERPQQMGPGDVVAVVADNMQRRGSLKTLVKQIQLGAI